MSLRKIHQFLKFFTLSLVLAACAKEENFEIAKKNFLLGEDQLAPVYKKNNVPADLQDSYIVVFKDDVNEDEIDGESERMCTKSSAKKERTFKHAVKGFSGRLSAAAIESFRRNPKVKFIEQNQVIQLVATTQTGVTWGIDRIDQADRPLSGTYTYNSTGSTVNAYIFDTGVRSSHVEFGGRVTGGFSAISTEPTPEDGNGHGTHVAGTVGGTIYGVAKNINIIPVKVLSATGSGTTTGVIAGLDWAVAHHVDEPAVGNMSLGGGASSALDAAVRRCISDGIVMAVAAGNSNVDASGSSPARVAEAITVGSTTSTDARSSFSNYGSIVDIFAPGSSITSAYYTSNTAVAILSGTSMASPHVAGAAALYLEHAPGSTPAQVEAALKQFAAVGRISGLTGRRANTPNNLLQITFGTPPTEAAPNAPTLSSPANNATNQSLSPTLSWAASSGATSYNLEYSTSSNFTSGNTLITGITSTSRGISGLLNSTTYYWRVNATNDIGTSDWSAVGNFTTTAPVTLPAAPTLRSPANNATNVSRTATMSWNAVTGATSYEIQISTDVNFGTITFGRSGLTGTSVRVSPSLGSRTVYYWRVRAANNAGSGGWSQERRFTTRR